MTQIENRDARSAKGFSKINPTVPGRAHFVYETPSVPIDGAEAKRAEARNPATTDNRPPDRSDRQA